MGTILVVDDEQAIRELLVELLLDSGHTILAATNGREALALAQAHHPQLIISDVLMPVLDGYALVAALRADAALAHTPIILMSASFAEFPPALNESAPPFVPKPFDQALLEGLVRHLA